MVGELPEKVMEKLRYYRDLYRGFKEGMDDRQERLWDALTFLLRFTALAAPFYLLLGTGWEMEGLREVTAQVSAIVLQLGGLEVASNGTFVSTSGFLLDVSWDSTGWKSVAVLIALISATPGGGRDKLGGIFAGLFVLFVINILRIATMVYAVVVFGIEYDILHLFLWRWGLTGAVALTWLSWMYLSRTTPRLSLPEI